MGTKGDWVEGTLADPCLLSKVWFCACDLTSWVMQGDVGGPQLPAHLLCRSQKTLPVTALLTLRSSENTLRKHLLSNKRGNSPPKELTGMVRVVNVCAGGGTGSAEH